MKPKISMRKALSDPKVLGRALRGPTWYGWRVLLIAAAGERLTPMERIEFKRLTGREREPGRPCRELVCIFGRRAGKTLALATFDCWIAACCDHRDVLAPGETGVALLISRDQRAAKIALDYIDGILRDSPVLSSLIANRTADAIELSNKISIEVRPCNRVSVRGPTYISITADEVAHWFTSADFANPDIEILGSAKPGLMTTGGPLLMVSSAYAKYGVLYDAFKKHYGPEGATDILVAYGTSRDLNPSLPQADIDRELEADPVRNRAEYLSEWRDDTAGVVPREVVEACIGDYRELMPRSGVIYYCFLDSASGSDGGDSYAIAISHRENDGRIVIDAVREAVPPFSPSSVVSDVLVPLCKAYRIDGKVWGDNYAGNYPKELVAKAGLYYDLWPAHKSELYRDPLLPLLNSKKITLPRIDRLINQTCTLERSVKRSGRDEITHPTHGHDDLVNVVAGAAAVAMRAALTEQRVPIVEPFVVESMFAPPPGGWTIGTGPPPGS
jgi:hypothetical protein